MAEYKQNHLFNVLDCNQSVLSLVKHLRFSVKESKIGWTMS
jgi:hypothetical protein